MPRRIVAGAAVLLLLGAPLAAQPVSTDARLRAQEDSVAKLRQERDDLQQKVNSLQGTAHTLSDELTNLSQRRTATQRVVQALDQQLVLINAEVEESSGGLARAQDELVVKRATLQRRLIDIYKRGPLNTIEVLLSATSFSNLIARYKWLHLLARRDQSLLLRVTDLHQQIAEQRDTRVQLQQQVELTRVDRAEEDRRLQDLTRQETGQLQSVQHDADAARTRIAAITRDEARMNTLIASLTAARNRTVAVPNAPGTASTGSTALRRGANLEWPVASQRLLFPFGAQRGENNTTTKRNGIGIAAPAGTPVRAVVAAQVDTIITGWLTYGTVVILNTPGGDFTIYGSLGSVAVKIHDIVNRGQVIGTVGVDPTLGPYLYFEVRDGNAPAVALDPMTILKRPQ